MGRTGADSSATVNKRRLSPPGEPQDSRPLHPGCEVLRYSFRKLQHHVQSLQTEGVRPCAGQPDQIAVQENAAVSRPELAQHGVKTDLGNLRIRVLKLLPQQYSQLPAADKVQLSEDFQDVFLLNGQKHSRHLLPGGASRSDRLGWSGGLPMLLRYGSTSRSLSLSAMQLKIVAMV